MGRSNKVTVGMIGLGTMGKNLALNMIDHGVEVVGYAKTKQSRDQAEQEGVPTASSLKRLASRLGSPKVFWLMVPSSAVEQVLDQLKPLLSNNDIIVEGGNSFYKDTARRVEWARKHKVRFIGTGVSGGEQGARHGPSLMPGGHKKAYDVLAPIFDAIAAKAHSQPCVAYLGKGGAGHFVKMVHNGIEYAIMGAIAESFHLLRDGGGLSQAQLKATYARWAKTEKLGGFLMEITAEVLAHQDAKTRKPFVEVVKDSAKQKGTGKWTVQMALDMGVPTGTIADAVVERVLSADKALRSAGAKALKRKDPKFKGSKQKLVRDVEESVYLAMLVAYAEGFGMMRSCADEAVCGVSLHCETIAKVWRAGCIIRSNMLEDIYGVFRKSHSCENIILTKEFAPKAIKAAESLRRISCLGADLGIPVSVLSQALTCVDTLRCERLPSTALIQAQRDYFGSHTYERVDRKGTFHTVWSEDKREVRRS